MGNKDEAVKSYVTALGIDDEDKAAWYRLGLLHLEMGRHSEADDCFEKAIDLDGTNPAIWMSKGLALEKQELLDDAIGAYDRAIALNPNDKEAWKRKGQVLMALNRPEQAMRAFEHSLSIDPYFEEALDGRKKAEEEIRRTKIEDYCRSILEFEYTHGRPVTKEEAFRVCGVPYAFLGEVLDYLSGKQEVSLSGMGKEDFEKYERISREILVNTMDKRDLGDYGLRLCDITVNFPDLKVSSAKRIMGYMQAVEEHEFSTHVTDPQVDAHLRQAMDLPNDQKSVLGIIRNLGVGVYQARQLVTILQTFKDAGFETPSIKIKSIVSDGYGEYVAFDERAAKTHAHRYAGEEPEPAHRQRRTDTRTQEYEERFEQPQRSRRKESREEEEQVDAPPAPKKAKPKTSKKEQSAEDVPSDLVGRRCLFHGGIAVARCSKCKAVLCRECVRSSDRCPRCNALLSGEDDVPEKPSRKPRREEEPDEEDGQEEVEEQEDEESEEPKKRPRKKDEPKGPDFNRL